jgi:hypothetical protein
MGKADNRRTKKMNRRRRQAKLKARLKRRMSPLRLEQAAKKKKSA